MSWRAILTLVLLAGAVLSGLALWSQRHPEHSTEAAAGRPDYVLHDFELISLDENGRESFTLRAPRLARDPDQKTLDIATPLFLIPTQPGSTSDAWQIRSATGWVSADGSELRLRGKVAATSDGRNGPVTTMATDQLNVFPKAKRAESATLVTIRRPGSILRGRGLEVSLATKQYSFKSEVQTRYVPTRR
ncbi:LPS export ABC transporter periplasmic protein LptC [Montanilutibacter psychrotolerans]|uniref:Lipopolysaccharide export system protein LptC n=1 Tax=Montanilutibacter psychrotolerans TaxID=1327343 RepID=A0A3M8SXE9_9GAMM|nr:LPS export ABC transporter periplasmic protein LptC [Lysobacter psychrotolerans]RNF86048.1 LPS export ABC transporter periplasmic protein LptC [Lysobacter psychrotolerans]